MTQGLIHIYCGDGKGKTSAALGLAVRAAGSGLKVLAARFLKNDRSGEVPVLEQISGIQVLSCEKSFGFSWTMTPQEKQEAGEYYTGLLRRAFDLGADLDVLVLDEICGAVSLGFIDEKVLLDALSRKPKGLEVVMTGRIPSEALLELADYVTEMKALKHPYEKGIEARAGIEY